MKFDELHATIPRVFGGKLKTLKYSPYQGVTIAMPGRHAEESEGGDFVVMVSDPTVKWRSHQFKHDDIFNDIELKATQGTYQDLMQRDAKALTHTLMESYLKVIRDGAEPSSVGNTEFDYLSGLRASVFLNAIQCLAVAEHRRYARYESQWGGRFLPFRFAAGIAEGLWSADDAIKVQRYGRPAVERLEKNNGLPALTKELMV